MNARWVDERWDCNVQMEVNSITLSCSYLTKHCCSYLTKQLTPGIQACVYVPRGVQTGSVPGFLRTHRLYQKRQDGSHSVCHLWPTGERNIGRGERERRARKRRERIMCENHIQTTHRFIQCFEGCSRDQCLPRE